MSFGGAMRGTLLALDRAKQAASCLMHRDKMALVYPGRFSSAQLKKNIWVFIRESWKNWEVSLSEFFTPLTSYLVHSFNAGRVSLLSDRVFLRVFWVTLESSHSCQSEEFPPEHQRWRSPWFLRQVECFITADWKRDSLTCWQTAHFSFSLFFFFFF